jgi:hypothetical protein
LVWKLKQLEFRLELLVLVLV